MDRRPSRDTDGFLTSPIYPEVTLAIVMARDFDGLSFPKIAVTHGMTKGGARKQYDRWKTWARGQRAYSKRLDDLKRFSDELAYRGLRGQR